MTTRSLRFFTLLVLTSAVPSLSFANRFWNGVGTIGSAGGGSGIWNTTNTNWETLASGGIPTTWNGADNNQFAIFGGVGGTVTLGNNFLGAASTADQAPIRTEILSSGYTFDAAGFSGFFGTAGVFTSLSSGTVMTITDSVDDNATNILTLPANSNPAIGNSWFFAQGAAAGTTAQGASALTSAHSIVVQGTIVRELRDGFVNPFGEAQIILRGGTGLDPSGWRYTAGGTNQTINMASRVITVEDNAVVNFHVGRSGSSGSGNIYNQPGMFTVGMDGKVVFTSDNTHRLNFTGSTSLAAGSELSFQANTTTTLSSVTLTGNATINSNNAGNATGRFVLLNLGSNQLSVGGTSTGGFQITAAVGPSGGDTVDRITGTGSIFKSAESILRITGQNTFSGGVTFRNGDLHFDNSSIGAPDAPISGPLGTGILNIGGVGVPRIVATAGPSQTLHNSVTVAGNFTVGPVNGAFTHPVIFAGSTTLTASPVIMTDVAGTFSGAIGDGGNAFSLTKAGTALLTLSGNNTYTGTTTISAGTLQIGSGGTSGSLASSSVSIATGATLSSNRDGALTLAMPISGAGNVAINNAATGTTALTSATNSYTGTTTVNSGTLQVGSSSTGTTGIGVVTVKTGATVLGTGNVQGSSFIAESGSTVRVGDDASVGTLGTLTFTPANTGGSIDFQSGSTTHLDLTLGGGGTDVLNFVGSGTQSLLFNGNLTVGPSTLAPTMAEMFNLLDWTSLASTTFHSRYLAISYSGLIFGNGDDNLGFDLPDVNGTGYGWDISNFTIDGSIALVVIPEPTRGILLLSGVTLVMLRRKRPTATA
jgi:autotransporter-associated beta strand protein